MPSAKRKENSTSTTATEQGSEEHSSVDNATPDSGFSRTAFGAEPREHTCHAIGCGEYCRPEHLMCRKHWSAVPDIIQRAVYRFYRPGQCDDMSPSEKWHQAADAAIASVAVLEGKPVRAKQLAELLKVPGKNLPWSLVTKIAALQTREGQKRIAKE